ncbi:MAG: hypothetical protein BMS9Abin33_1328 [Gammaproteobacteria bacterium]|nr:MAG: hypothetical protein BMS9Abin33_1328 [Gammaproteobacteria bacterium]
MRSIIIALFMATSVLLVGCAGNPDSPQARECRNGLSVAYKELDAARGKTGAVDFTKAVSLLTAAKIQLEFEKYPNCIDKVKRARAYIRHYSKN